MNGVPYGGGDVEANPSGTATDTLTKLGIEGTVYEIQGGGSGSNLIIDAQIYSTEEKQVGVWTDGKPLYQKTYANVNLSNNQDVVIDANVSTMQLKSYVIDFSGTTNTSTKQIGDTSDTLYIDSRGLVYWINRPSGWWSALNNANITVWYTKTTDTAGSGGYQAYGFSPIIYSTEEREVGVWTDNKPLYQKTIIKSGTISQRETISLGIANVENIFLVSDASNVNNGRTPLPLVTGTDNNNNTGGFFDIQQSDTSFLFRIGSGMAGYVENAIITVRYTKTTDIAGNGEYNTLGIPNVHYDGNEKVIGTWFGETLYEKTFTGTTGSNNTYFIPSTDNIAEAPFITGFITADNFNFSAPYVDGSDYISLGQSSGGIRLYYSNYFKNKPYKITVQYTKTT